MTAAFLHSSRIAPMPQRRIPRAAQSLAARLAAWRRRRRERAELASLTPAELRDAGIAPYDAKCEARKPFWRA